MGKGITLWGRELLYGEGNCCMGKGRDDGMKICCI